MSLAIDSYRGNVPPADGDGRLSLVWTVDEQDFLRQDIPSLVSRELANELRAGARGVGRYLVEDPYGEEALSPAVRAFFGLPGWTGALTCGAGVISLLHGLAGLSAGGPACVIGDAYPDFPHWVQRWGGTCLGKSPSGLADRGEDPLGDARPRLIFLERPSLFGTALDDLVTIRWLCERAADRDALVVVDESNANYRRPAYSAVPLTGDVPNLVVVRGFSKAYGMGGLRLGYCASSPELRGRLRGLIPPLLASSLSLRIGAAILRAGDVAEPLRARIVTAKRLLVRFLATAGFTDVLPAGDDLPYVFLAGATGPIHARLLQRGVIGKPHGSWSWARRDVTFLYRLATPLRDDRLDVLRRQVSAEPDRLGKPAKPDRDGVARGFRAPDDPRSSTRVR